MTKTILLTATAFAAIGFAGAANAQAISSAEVSGIQTRATVGGVVTNSPYVIASESVSSAENRRTLTAVNTNDVTFTTTGGTNRLELGTTYRINYTLAGTATPTFLAQVVSGALTVAAGGGNQACIASTTLAAGTGAGGSNTVSFIVRTVDAFGGACAVAADLPNTFNVDIPFGIGALGTVTANVSGSLDPSNTNPAAATNRFSATGSTVSLVQSAPGYRMFASGVVDGATNDGLDNADLATNLALESSGAPFRSFASTDRIIGAAGLVLAGAPVNTAGVFANLAAAALTPPSYTLSVSPTSGDFTVLRPTHSTSDAYANETDFTVAANNLSATAGTTGAPVTDARNINLRIEGQPTTSIATTPQSYTVTVSAVAPAANSTLVQLSSRSLANAPLETVGLQGTTFIAPWVQSSNANYNTVLRVSNNGGGSTGSVQLTIASALAPTTRTVCTAAELPKLSGISAGSELAINSADLTTCFGNFTRGDVSLTVLSLSSNLTAKLRIVSPGGVVTEQSLGRFGAPVAY